MKSNDGFIYIMYTYVLDKVITEADETRTLEELNQWSTFASLYT